MESHPGAGGGFEIKSKVRLGANTERITINIEGKDEYVPRRLRITKRDSPGLSVSEPWVNGSGSHGGVQIEDHGGAGESGRPEDRERDGEVLRVPERRRTRRIRPGRKRRP